MNASSPLVSVAIVTYNQLPFLKECVDSVLRQDYTNMELVIADDGSKDGTQEWLRALPTQLDGRRIVARIAERNGGITKNSNAAFHACTGKYTCWLGGDDLMLPGKVSKQVSYLESNPSVAICYHDLDVFDSDSNRTLYLYSQRTRPLQGDIRTAIRGGTFNGASSTMVRTADCPKHGFDERIPAASDWLFWLQTLAGGKSIGYIDEVLGRYRRSSMNVTSADPREPRMPLEQDHFNSCSLLLSEFPEYAADIQYRLAYLLESLRFRDHGARYRHYLVASLRARFNVRVVAKLAINVLTGRKP